MTKQNNNFRSRACAWMFLLGVGIGIATPASAIEAMDIEADSTMLTRMQDLASQASRLTVTALDMAGVRYRYGGDTPESGFDCSGLVRHVFSTAWNRTLPRTSLEISRAGEKIEVGELQPGDLVFYNTLKRRFSHVGIYLGDHKFIHSPASGGKVRIENMNLAYWKQRFNGARRISAAVPQP
jgi:cell wall-associated NlpC family hydrolase